MVFIELSLELQGNACDVALCTCVSNLTRSYDVYLYNGACQLCSTSSLVKEICMFPTLTQYLCS